MSKLLQTKVETALSANGHTGVRFRLAVHLSAVVTLNEDEHLGKLLNERVSKTGKSGEKEEEEEGEESFVHKLLGFVLVFTFVYPSAFC